MSLITVVMVAVLVFLSRHDIAHAWHLLGQVDLRILWLVIPLIVLSYLATGEAMFSYLRQKKLIKSINPFKQMTMSLELNFVNHVLPSGGVSGMSYMAWLLSKYGVSSGKATMAQIVRYATSFVASAVLLAFAVLFVTIDGTVNRWIILTSSVLVFGVVLLVIFGIYALSSERRVRKIAYKISHFVSALVRRVTFGRVPRILRREACEKFMLELHEDFTALRRDKKILWQPFWWNVVFIAVDIATYWMVFWALGSVVNPAAILVGYSLAAFAGVFFMTPGGTGVYEMIMVMILVLSGMSQGQAIAGVVLTRVIVLLVAVGVGYVFYQRSLIKYGKKKDRA